MWIIRRTAMHTKNISAYRIIMMVVLIAVSLLFIFPFYWIVTGAFKLQKVAIQMPMSLS